MRNTWCTGRADNSSCVLASCGLHFLFCFSYTFSLNPFRPFSGWIRPTSRQCVSSSRVTTRCFFRLSITQTTMPAYGGVLAVCRPICFWLWVIVPPVGPNQSRRGSVMARGWPRLVNTAINGPALLVSCLGARGGTVGPTCVDPVRREAR